MPSPRGCSRRGCAWPPSQRSLHGQQALEQREQSPARPPSAGCHRNRRKTQNQRLSQRKVPSSKPGLAGDPLHKLPEATSEERTALKGPPTGDRSDFPDVLRQPQGGHVGGAFWLNSRQNLPDRRTAAHARWTLPVSLSGQVLIMSPCYRGDRPQWRLGAITRGQEQSGRTTAGLRALPQRSSSAHKAQLCHMTLSFSHSTDQRQQPGQTQGTSAELTSRWWGLLTLVLCNWVKLSPICCQVSGQGCNSQQQQCSRGKTNPTAQRSIFF